MLVSENDDDGVGRRDDVYELRSGTVLVYPRVDRSLRYIFACRRRRWSCLGTDRQSRVFGVSLQTVDLSARSFRRMRFSTSLAMLKMLHTIVVQTSRHFGLLLARFCQVLGSMTLIACRASGWLCSAPVDCAAVDMPYGAWSLTALWAEDSLQDPAVWHSVDMTDSTVLRFDDECFNAGYLEPAQNFRVDYFVLPPIILEGSSQRAQNWSRLWKHERSRPLIN